MLNLSVFCIVHGDNQGFVYYSLVLMRFKEPRSSCRSHWPCASCSWCAWFNLSWSLVRSNEIIQVSSIIRVFVLVNVYTKLYLR